MTDKKWTPEELCELGRDLADTRNAEGVDIYDLGWEVRRLAEKSAEAEAAEEVATKTK